MPTVEVDQRWIEELKSIGNNELDDLESVVAHALRAHIFHLRQQKIAKECQFYEKNHSEVFQKYQGKFVAIHNETVFDADEDGQRLSKRVREQFGRIPIAILKVREIPELPIFKVRFLNQFTAGLGDYTVERQIAIEKQTLEEALSEVYHYQAERSAQNPESDH